MGYAVDGETAARLLATLLVAGTLGSLAACGDATGSAGTGGAFDPNEPVNRVECSLPQDQIFDGGVSRNTIPSLFDPQLVSPGDPGLDYLRDDDRVVGVRLDDGWVAIPHNILWWHEIVQFRTVRAPPSSQRLAVSYCPLTGSSLAFDMSRVSEFLVSGTLFNNNLMMLDSDTESLWPQMARAAKCGPRDGSALQMFPIIEMTWDAWRTLHPDTRVVSGETGFSRDYTRYPYGRYEELDVPPLFPIPAKDDRRRVKERVLGLPGDGSEAIAFPFLELAELGDPAVARAEYSGAAIVVLWDSEAAAAMAYRPVVGGTALTFEADGDGIVDVETGSRWRVDGLATEGSLAGARLEPVAEAHVAFWFAWHTFHPDTRLWEAGQ